MHIWLSAVGGKHSQGHTHGHAHDHAHGHAPRGHGRAFAGGVLLNAVLVLVGRDLGRWLGRGFAVVVLLNSVFVLVEAGFGLWSGSMALVADAGHNLSDVLSLLIAWGASVMAARPANPRFTYGYKSSSILAALANAGLL